LTEALLSALANFATLEHFVYLAFGVMLGLAIGAFPGLGGIAGLSIMMPFLYGMDTLSALAMLVGLVAVIPTSDTFTSVLMGIPGSSASQATVLDGFPLSQQGQAARALAAAFTASLVGGLVGAVILTLFALAGRWHNDVAPDGERFLLLRVDESSRRAPVTVVVGWQALVPE